jgi:hypothetical protein
MKFFHTLSFSIVLSLGVEVAFAQHGFIRTDSAYTSVQLVRQTDILNSKEVKYIKKPGNEIIKLFPKDIIEYGFTRGETYSTIKVRDVDSTRLYFARLLSVNDKLKLFMIRTLDGNRIFVMENEKLDELHGDSSFRTKLSAYLNTCDQPTSWIRDVNFSRKSLTRAFSLHTSCYNGIFPRIRTGFLIGYSLSTLTVTGTQGEAVSMGSSDSPLAGIFIDVPLGKKKAIWSVTVQSYFQKSNFHVSNNTLLNVQEYIANTSFVNLPILFKYHFSAVKTSTYFGFGMASSYYFTRDNYKYEAVISGSQVTVTKTNYNSINKLQIGGILGTGVNIKVMERILLNFELQYQYGKGVDVGDDFVHSLSTVQLISSISF